MSEGPPHTAECVSHTGLQCDCAIVDYKMDPDTQEALSIRYAEGLWVVPLSSGAWAIFGPDRRLRLITQTLREEVLREIVLEIRGQWQVEIEPAGRELKTNKNLEELDL